MILPRVEVITRTIMDRFLRESASASASFETIVICQLTTASVSFVASSVMVIMIIRTEKRLSTPYRRIIFGLGMADVMWSLSFVTGPFFLPSDTPSSWGMGNRGTCRASGFSILLFYGLVPMYTCFLCFYYLCKLKYKMTNEEFARRFEWKGHIFVNSLSVVLSIVAIALDTIHPGAFRTNCVLAATPLGCRVYPQLVGECDATIERRVNAVTLVSQGLRVLWLIAVIVIMSNLYWHVIATNRMHSGGSASAGAEADDDRGGEQIESLMPNSSNNSHDDSYNSEDSEEEEARGWPCSSSAHGEKEKDNDDRDQEDPETNIAPPALNETQLSQSSHVRTNLEYLSTLYRNEIALQGTFYTLAYFATHFPTLLFYGFVMTDNHPPKWVQILPFVLAPLGGFFIMLVYTRPQIAYLRRHNPQLSRLKAFWLVLRAGGEVPEEPNNVIPHRYVRDNLRARQHRRGRGPGRGRGRRHYPQQQQQQQQLQDQIIGDESISTIQFIANSSHKHGQDVASSVLVMDGESLSIIEGDLNYNPESKWSYVQGGSKMTEGSMPAKPMSESNTDAQLPAGTSYKHGQDAASSVLVMDGESLSISEGNSIYNPESKWSYVQGGSEMREESVPAEPMSESYTDAQLPAGTSPEEEHHDTNQPEDDKCSSSSSLEDTGPSSPA